jgi:hypothetical protein
MSFSATSLKHFLKFWYLVECRYDIDLCSRDIATVIGSTASQYLIRDVYLPDLLDTWKCPQ